MFNLDRSDSIECEIGDTIFIKNQGAPADGKRIATEPGFNMRLRLDSLAAIESQEFFVSNYTDDRKPNGYGTLVMDSHLRILEGLARLVRHKIGILGDEKWNSDTISVQLILDDGTWHVVPAPHWPERPKGGHSAAIYHFEELNRWRDTHWTICIAVPEKLFDRIHSSYASGRLKFLEVKIKADMWCRKSIRYDEESNDLFLKPGEIGAAFVTDLVYREHPHIMSEIDQSSVYGRANVPKNGWLKSFFR